MQCSLIQFVYRVVIWSCRSVGFSVILFKRHKTLKINGLRGAVVMKVHGLQVYQLSQIDGKRLKYANADRFDR